MKIYYPDLFEPIQLTGNKVVSLVIENQKLMHSFVSDLFSQVSGLEGETILSKSNKEVEISKWLEVINDYFLFDMNKRSIINKIISRINDFALNEDEYESTMELLGEIEQRLYKWTFDTPCDIMFTNITPLSLIKAANVSICNDYVTNKEKAEQLLDYMELVKEYDREKVFVFVNMRSFFPDDVMKLFVKSVVDHGYLVVLVDNKDNSVLEFEERITIDIDLCKF